MHSGDKIRKFEKLQFHNSYWKLVNKVCAIFYLKLSHSGSLAHGNLLNLGFALISQVIGVSCCGCIP